MLPKIVTMLPSFLSYLVVAMLLLTGFLLIYVKVTPYDEIDLIRKGNVAAAISLSGALLGFAMPVANVIAHSDALLDLTVWGIIAGVIQLLTYLVARFTLPHLTEDIPNGQVASGIFVASLSMVVGLTNAACLSY